MVINSIITISYIYKTRWCRSSVRYLSHKSVHVVCHVIVHELLRIARSNATINILYMFVTNYFMRNIKNIFQMLLGMCNTSTTWIWYHKLAFNTGPITTLGLMGRFWYIFYKVMLTNLQLSKLSIMSLYANYKILLYIINIWRTPRKCISHKTKIMFIDHIF